MKRNLMYRLFLLPELLFLAVSVLPPVSWAENVGEGKIPLCSDPSSLKSLLTKERYQRVLALNQELRGHEAQAQSAAKKLEDALNTGPWDIRFAAAVSLLRSTTIIKSNTLAQEILQRYTNENIERLLAKSSDKDIDERCFATKMYGYLYSFTDSENKEAIIGHLIRALGEKSLELRPFAVESLGEIGSDAAPAVERLVVLFNSTKDKPESAMRCARTLMMIGTSEALQAAYPFIVKSLAPGNPILQQNALAALYQHCVENQSAELCTQAAPDVQKALEKIGNSEQERISKKLANTILGFARTEEKTKAEKRSKTTKSDNSTRAKPLDPAPGFARSSPPK